MKIQVKNGLDEETIEDLITNADLTKAVLCAQRISFLDAKLTRMKNTARTYGVSSPAIRSEEEAKYKTSAPYNTEGRAARLVNAISDTEYQLTSCIRFCKAVFGRLSDLSEEDLDILYERYELGMSASDIAAKRFLSRDTILRRLAKIRKEVATYEL